MRPSRREYPLRFVLAAVLFCAVAVFYLGKLFAIQFRGLTEDDFKITKRYASVQTVRGEIYDRNGKKLVRNRYSYNAVLTYASFADQSMEARNRELLDLADLLDRNGIAQPYAESVPFEGTYPFLGYSEANRAKVDQVMSDLGFLQNTEASKFVDYYVRTYALLAVDGNGARLFNDDEVHRLLLLRFDMDYRRFSPVNDYTLASGLDQEALNGIEGHYAGVGVTVSTTREYCYPGYASHVLGSVGPIYSEEWEYYNEKGYQMNAIVGKDGCEAAFEEYLRGTDGQIVIEEDQNGNILRRTVVTEPVAGRDVYLTIDIDLQIAAEDALAENVRYISESVSNGGECVAGAAVVMDPNTFEVLAVASHPTFDLTTYRSEYDLLKEDEALPLFNRALLGTYAPGSTYKLGVAVAALSEGVITRNSIFHCTGNYRGVGCSTYGTNHAGDLDVTDALAYSCNSFFCEMGDRLGIERMDRYMQALGIGESTGLELPNADGILSSPAYLTYLQDETHPTWLAGDTWRTAIGQAFNTATPLQLCAYVSTLVNGGTRRTAHLLHSVRTFGEDEPDFAFDTGEASIRSELPISSSTLSIVKEGMKKVITTSNLFKSRGWFQTLPVTVGAKTGTAQTGGSVENALFVCAAPIEAPEITISVVLEKGVGGSYAALTADRILREYYK